VGGFVSIRFSFIALVVCLVGLGAALLLWRRVKENERRELADFAAILLDWIAAAQASLPFDGVDQWPADDLPKIDRHVVAFGPAVEGFVMRIQNAGEGFLAAHRDGQPALCTEMLMQLSLATLDLKRGLSRTQAGSRPRPPLLSIMSARP
jgi:hypothetical protein